MDAPTRRVYSPLDICPTCNVVVRDTTPDGFESPANGQRGHVGCFTRVALVDLFGETAAFDMINNPDWRTR